MVIWKGTRPLLVESQSLVVDSHFGLLNQVAVVLDEIGVKVTETAADLALLMAALSSFRDQPLPQDLIVFGEVGLSGEIRPVPSGQERIREAAKHGFKRAIVPKANAPRNKIEGMQVIAVESLQQALEQF